jgi:hypothetical protein
MIFQAQQIVELLFQGSVTCGEIAMYSSFPSQSMRRQRQEIYLHQAKHLSQAQATNTLPARYS